MSNQIFNLDPRLLVCAKLVRNNTTIADIGTDHAYLPIWLYQNNIISGAIASDLRTGPLLNAKNNIKKYKLSDVIETRISDGLNAINQNEADDIIIAGIGGQIIADIISRATWLKDPLKHLILQPMTKDEYLREFLLKENYAIIQEHAVTSANKVYSVMSVKYSFEPIACDILYQYIGKIDLSKATPEASLYISQKIKKLKKRKTGFLANNNFSEAKKLDFIIQSLNQE